MSRHHWLLEPKDPLFFGDGRPISTGPATGRLLPPPSTLAGAHRTWWGNKQGLTWNHDTAAQVRKMEVHGPFLVLLDDKGGIKDWLFPAPADALELAVDGARGDNAQRRILPLVPLDIEGVGKVSDPGGEVPAGLAKADRSKPWSRPLPLWSWEGALASWLVSPGELAVRPDGSPVGLPGPAEEPRVGIALNEDGVTVEGAYFVVRGHRWEVPTSGSSTPSRLGLVSRTGFDLGVDAGTLGGERKLVRIRKAPAALPSCPPEVLESAEKGHVRLILATPALLTRGNAPGDGARLPPGSEVICRLNGRYQVVSGWDHETRRPKPTRRMLPAGSTWFISLGGSPEERRAWAESTWLASVSDVHQDRLDGFGITLIGTWDGQKVTPNFNSR